MSNDAVRLQKLRNDIRQHVVHNPIYPTATAFRNHIKTQLRESGYHWPQIIGMDRATVQNRLAFGLMADIVNSGAAQFNVQAPDLAPSAPAPSAPAPRPGQDGDMVFFGNIEVDDRLA